MCVLNEWRILTMKWQRYMLVILILIMSLMITTSCSSDANKDEKVITDKDEITEMLVPVAESLPKIYDLKEGTLTGKYKGALMPGGNSSEQLVFNKQSDHLYSYTYNYTDENGTKNEINQENSEIIFLQYPTKDTLNHSIDDTVKLTVTETEGGTLYRLDRNIDDVSDVKVKDIYETYFLNDDGFITEYVFHFINTKGDSILESSNETNLMNYK